MPSITLVFMGIFYECRVGPCYKFLFSKSIRGTQEEADITCANFYFHLQVGMNSLSLVNDDIRAGIPDKPTAPPGLLEGCNPISQML